jgi:V8-like Glu-specific endopeptidase
VYKAPPVNSQDQHPWHAALVYHDGQYCCAGSLISPTAIVTGSTLLNMTIFFTQISFTAAHCVTYTGGKTFDAEEKNIYVILGMSNLTEINDATSGGRMQTLWVRNLALSTPFAKYQRY